MARDAARRALALALLALLLVGPLAEAHIQGARPILQRGQRERLIGLDVGAIGVAADLSLTGDPLRQVVRHTLDPHLGLFTVEHRADGSRADDRFHVSWRFERLVEYKDQNVDGLFQRESDTAVKAWRFQHYRWNRAAIQQAQVGDVRANDIVWEANLTGGPRIRMEGVIAGKDFSDEGAVVRPQDVAIYLDLTQMPTRGFGNLYAMEITVTAPGASRLSFHRAQNTSTALLVDGELRRGLLVWGGEASLDGSEQRLGATIEDERVGDDGNRTAKLVLHLATVDESMRFVMVSGLEYGTEDRRAPLGGALALLAVLLALAVARRRR